MLTYKGRELIRIETKIAGKNRGSRNGFYRDSTGAEFFVKEPLDKKELFTELLAGLIIRELIQRGLIPAIYQDSLIFADLLQFEDGSYGLIQPRIRFTELYKIIQTGYHDNSDRNLFLEMFFGPDYYPLLLEEEQYFGLSIVFMIAFLVGDYSLHSSNVVVLNEEEEIKQLAKIDWGAAFRYFGYKNNHSNLFHPAEYQGFGNFKGFTKGYVLNYKYFTGLFPAIAEKAKNLMKLTDEALFEELISTVLGQIPPDLIDDTVRKALSDYLGMESFKHVEFGTKRHQQFAIELAQIFWTRLQKIAELKDPVPKGKHSKLYRSVELKSDGKVIGEDSFRFFPQQVATWRNRVVAEENNFDFTKISLPFLVKQFNYFLGFILDQGLQYKKEEQQLTEVPDDFLTQPEILRQLFTLTEEASPGFSESQKLQLNENETFWLMIESVLALGVHIVVSLNVLQGMASVAGPGDSKAEDGSFLIDAIKELLVLFEQAYQPVDKLLGLSERVGCSPSFSF